MTTVHSRVRIWLLALALLVQAVVVTQPAKAAHFTNIQIICGSTAFLACDEVLAAAGGTFTVRDFPPDAEPPTGAACKGTPKSDFTDREDGTLGEALAADCMGAYPVDSDKKLLGGTSDGKANLKEKISRAQYLLTLLRAADLADKKVAKAQNRKNLAAEENWLNPASPTFPDVPKTHPFYKQIETAVSLGLFSGTNTKDTKDLDGDKDFEETLFLPNAKITAAQIYKADANLVKKYFLGLPLNKDAESTGLDCRAFADSQRFLEEVGVLGLASNLPMDCIDAADRGQAYDLLGAITNLMAGEGLVDNPFKPKDGTSIKVVIEPADSGSSRQAMSSHESSPAGQKRWAVTDPTGTDEYTIVLFQEERVDTSSDERVVFVDGTGGPVQNGTANPGTVESSIISVNGKRGSYGQKTTAKIADDLLIQFTVDGVYPERVVPIVFIDANGDGLLALNEDGTPAEDHHFGAGGLFEVPEPAALAISPTTTTFLLDDDVAPGETSDQRTYTVNTPETMDHVVVLFKPSSFAQDAQGVYFRAANGARETGGTAQPPFLDARIVKANGSAITPSDDVITQPSGGTLTFTVDIAERESVIPVVFVDERGDGLLGLDSTGHPLQLFAIGGRIDGLKARTPSLAGSLPGVNSIDLSFTGVLSTATLNVHIGDDTGNVGDPTAPALNASTFKTQTFTQAATGRFTDGSKVIKVTNLASDTPYQLYFSQTLNGVTSLVGGVEIRTGGTTGPVAQGAFAYQSSDATMTNELRVNFSSAVASVPNPTGLSILVDGVTYTAVRASIPPDPISTGPGIEWSFFLDGQVPFGSNFDSRLSVKKDTARDANGNSNPVYVPFGG